MLLEWFVIGLSPWSNPDANPWLMLGFQLGMFSFWSTVGFMPWLVTDGREPGQRACRAAFKFCVPFFTTTCVIGFLVPEAARFGTIIIMIVAGYLALNLFYLKFFLGHCGTPERPAA